MPHGDRSKVAIEPFLTDQWYVDAATLAKPALEAVRDGRTRIQPEQHEKTYFHWLGDHRALVHLAPALVGPPDPGLVRAEEGGLRGPRRDRDGRPARTPPTRRSSSAAACPTSASRPRPTTARGRGPHRRRPDADLPLRHPVSGAEPTSRRFVEVNRDPDVLDTWFSSGIWPIGTLGWPEDTPELTRYYPTSVLVTGFDIIFFWVARMMMMQLALVGEVPFREVYIHALVRDEKGKKMSKSLGNILDPIELIDEFGADAVRFTLAAMAAMGRDLKLSRDRIAGYRNFGTKLWNAARFAEMNDCRPDAGVRSARGDADRQPLDRRRDRAAARDAGRGARRLPLQRRGERAACPRLGQGLRLVRRACEAALRRRRRGGDPGDDGLGARPVPGADASVHAVHHRGALGRDRGAGEAPRPCRLAGLRRRS